MKRWPEGNLTKDQWQELVAIEYTITMYHKYYTESEYDDAVNRMHYLSTLRGLF